VTGSSVGFPALWLRHNCPCAECLDPVTGQRLIEVTAIPNGCGATVEAQTAESVTVVFTPDRHRAVFRRTWLADRALPAGPAAPRPRSPWLSGKQGPSVVGRERTDYTGPDELVERASLRPPLFR
jgi:Gamma-butyrobetaine hydroxylase-like, N-terminal